MRKKKETVYNVRIVEDKSKEPLGLKSVLLIIFMVFGVYLLFNGKDLADALINDGSFLGVLKETGKELVYATGLTFVVYIANSIAFFPKKK